MMVGGKLKSQAMQVIQDWFLATISRPVDNLPVSSKASLLWQYNHDIEPMGFLGG
jgi:hypothetical protein